MYATYKNKVSTSLHRAAFLMIAQACNGKCTITSHSLKSEK